MSKKKAKLSFLIPKDKINQVLTFLLTQEIVKLSPNSRFQLLNGSQDSNHFTLYKSGIILFDPSLLNFISSILDNFDINVDLKSKSTEDKFQKSKKMQVRSIWISNNQKKRLLDKISQSEKFKIIADNKQTKIKNLTSNTYSNISKNNIIQFNTSTQIEDWVIDVIEDQTQFANSDINIGISSHGLKSKFGPIIISTSIIDKNQAENLQLQGIRNRTQTRSSNDDKILKMVIEMQISYNSLVFDPSIINEQENITSEIEKQIVQLIKTNLDELDDEKQIKMYISPKDPLLELLKQSNVTEILEVNEEKAKFAISNAVSSVISEHEYQKWKKKMEIELGRYISPKIKVENELLHKALFHNLIPLDNIL